MITTAKLLKICYLQPFYKKISQLFCGLNFYNYLIIKNSIQIFCGFGFCYCFFSKILL